MLCDQRLLYQPARWDPIKLLHPARSCTCSPCGRVGLYRASIMQNFQNLTNLPSLCNKPLQSTSY